MNEYYVLCEKFLLKTKLNERKTIYFMILQKNIFQCMFQSWYLAVDTQLFMLAPIILYPLWRWRKTGEFLLGSSIVISVLIPCLITYYNKLDPTLMLFAP